MNENFELENLKKAFDLSSKPEELRNFIKEQIVGTGDYREFCRYAGFGDDQVEETEQIFIEGSAQWIETLQSFDKIKHPELLDSNVETITTNYITNLFQKHISASENPTDYIGISEDEADKMMARLLIENISVESIKNIYMSACSLIPE